MAMSAAVDPWGPLRVFEGNWEGPTRGKPGAGSTSRAYRFEMGGRFLTQRDKSVYRSTGAGAEPLVHEDFGVFSFDATQRRIVWRQFHSESFVNEYILESVGPQGTTLEFVTMRIENLPGGRAKKLYRILSPDEFEETFLLAVPDQEFEVYTESRLKRVT